MILLPSSPIYPYMELKLMRILLPFCGQWQVSLPQWVTAMEDVADNFFTRTFLPYLGEAVISRVCFSCTRGVMKKRLKKNKWGDDFGAKLLVKVWVTVLETISCVLGGGNEGEETLLVPWLPASFMYQIPTQTSLHFVPTKFLRCSMCSF